MEETQQVNGKGKDELLTYAKSQANVVLDAINERRRDAGKKEVEWNHEAHTLMLLRLVRFAFPEIDTPENRERLIAFRQALMENGIGHNASQFRQKVMVAKKSKTGAGSTEDLV